jgi:SAM-dependent methyltransferase
MKARHSPLEHALFCLKQGIKVLIKKISKQILFYSPFRNKIFPSYRYNFSPQQLCFLCECLRKTKQVAGNVAEIGCDTGRTTVFLNYYLTNENIDKKYFAIDTFSGFVAEDIKYEVTNRSKKRILYDAFRVNKKKWFDATIRQNNIARVKSMEADVNEFDLRTLGPLAFVLLDVDLYRPMRKALPELYEALSPGGIIVVDDCTPDDFYWDGSHQAYLEFMSELNQAPHIVCEKLGVVQKPQLKLGADSIKRCDQSGAELQELVSTELAPEI